MKTLAPLPLAAALAALPLTACASGPSATSFAPAPSARTLGTTGYAAPELPVAAPRAPMRVAQVAPTAAVQASASVATPLRLSEARGDAAPEVPAPPARRWSEETRAPLPDLDEILVTHEGDQVARSEPAAQPPARSVLPTERRAAPAPRPAARRSGDYALHLASYREPGQAALGWDVLTREHPDALGDLAPARAAIDIEGRGRFHRLIAGPLPQGRADAACAALEDEGTYCAVVLWNGTPL